MTEKRKRSQSSERRRKISDSSRTKLAVQTPEKNGRHSEKTAKNGKQLPEANGKSLEVAVKPPESPAKKAASLTTLYHFADGVDMQVGLDAKSRDN